MFGQKMRGQKRSTSHDSRIKQKNIVNSKINNPNSTNIIYYRELLYVQQNALKKEQKSIERQIE